MIENILRTHTRIKENVARDFVGKDNIIDLLYITLLSNGHILLDDVPGTGKTLLAKSFAKSIGLDFKRIQCVPDLLPSDIFGVNYFNFKNSEFKFIPGPVFTNILLVDEINRTTPKTQSGLLECMEERQVSVDGETYKLKEPFMVIATQNPIESKGTFELPEAQLDRFWVKATIGYPKHEESIEIVERKITKNTNEQTTVVGLDELTLAISELNNVFVHRDVISYAATICEATRNQKEVILGASPRALIHLIFISKGYAAINGRDYVLPDDIKYTAPYVLAHRLILNNSFYMNRNLSTEIIDKILNEVPVPSEDINFSRRY